MRKPWGIWLVLGTGILFSACSGMPGSPSHYGSENAVSQSRGPRPEWIDNLEVFRKSHRNKLWFSGATFKKADREDGRQEAYLDAIRSIAKGIRETVHSFYIRAKTVDDMTSKGLYTSKSEHEIDKASFSHALRTITGANADSYWWRKFWIQQSPESPVQYYYDVYSLVSISSEAYNQDVDRTLEGLADELQDRGTRKIAQYMKNHYMNRRQTP
jgi:hypothetical protein